MKHTAETFETVLVPLAGHVRMPLPSRKDRAEFVASLDAESARVKSGESTLFEKDSFLERLRQDYAENLKNK